MKSYLRALFAAFGQQWQKQLTLSSTLAPLLSAVALAVGVGWIVGRSDNAEALSHVFVGAPLMGLWQMGVFRAGWSLEGERYEGTLDLLITTRTPLVVILFGKTLAIMTSQVLTAGVTLGILVAFAQDFVSIDSVPLLMVSALLAIGGVVATSFIFAPFTFLVGGRGGFFNAIEMLKGVSSVTAAYDGMLSRVIVQADPAAGARECIAGLVDDGIVESILEREPTLEEAYLHILR